MRTVLLALLASAAACAGQPCTPSWEAVGDNIAEGSVEALAFHFDGKTEALYSGGRMRLDAGWSNVARLEGNRWVSVAVFDPPVPNGSWFPPHVQAIVSFDDGTGPALYAGGEFSVNGVGFVARRRGGAWEPLGQGLRRFWLEFFDHVTTMHAHGGRLYVGGPMELALSPFGAGLARWTGAGWADVAGSFQGLGPNGFIEVDSLLSSGSDLVAGGHFYIPSAQTGGIARFDGAVWHPLNYPSGIGPSAVSHRASGELWGVRDRMLTFFSGGQWQWFPCGVGVGDAIDVTIEFDDGSGPALYVAGDFGSLSSGVIARNMTRVGVGGCEPNPGGPNAPVRAAITARDGENNVLYIGGDFTEVQGVPVSRVARLVACPSSCYPDCNGDGALTLADFGCFMTKFAVGNLYADCNADGLLQLSDFGCFQTRFLFGCP